MNNKIAIESLPQFIDGIKRVNVLKRFKRGDESEELVTPSYYKNYEFFNGQEVEKIDIGTLNKYYDIVSGNPTGVQIKSELSECADASRYDGHIDFALFYADIGNIFPDGKMGDNDKPGEMDDTLATRLMARRLTWSMILMSYLFLYSKINHNAKLYQYA